MYIHKIDKQKHHNFLEEERKDPVTSDLITVGNDVVFCSRCKSAFLKESWEFIERRHCGQSQTLRKFPISKTLLLNVATIQPDFMTLTNSSTSFEESLKFLSFFHPNDKKVGIILNDIIKRGTKEYRNLVKKTQRKIEKLNEEIGNEGSKNENEEKEGKEGIQVNIGAFLAFLDQVSTVVQFP